MEISGRKIRARGQTERPRLHIGRQRGVLRHERRGPHLQVRIEVSAQRRIEAVAQRVVEHEVAGRAQGQHTRRAQRSKADRSTGPNHRRPSSSALPSWRSPSRLMISAPASRTVIASSDLIVSEQPIEHQRDSLAKAFRRRRGNVSPFCTHSRPDRGVYYPVGSGQIEQLVAFDHDARCADDVAVDGRDLDVSASRRLWSTQMQRAGEISCGSAREVLLATERSSVAPARRSSNAVRSMTPSTSRTGFERNRAAFARMIEFLRRHC